ALGFGARLRLGGLQHNHDLVARDEAHAGVVCDHEIAGIDLHAADHDRPVDLRRLDAPLAGYRRDVAWPGWIAYGALVRDISNAALHAGAGFGLTLAGLGRVAGHVGDVRHAIDHQYGARRCEVMALELGHLVDVGLCACERLDALQDVA